MTHAWVIRSGRHGERDAWAVQSGCSGGGWVEVQDLTECSTRDDVAHVTAKAYAGAADSKLANFTGQLWALRGRIAPGDLMVMPIKTTKQIALGRVTGSYEYRAGEQDGNKRHVVAVDWQRTDLPRSAVRRDLLFTLGSAMTIFSPNKNNALARLELPGYSASDDEEAPEDEDAPEDEEAPEDEQEAPPEPIDWLGLRRREPSSKRGARPNQFYGIFVDEETGHLHSVGEALDDHVDRHKVKVPKGTVAIRPLDSKKRETLRGLTPDQLRANWAKGYARVYNWKPAKKTGTVHLTTGTIEKIASGQVTIITPGRRRWRGCPGRRTRPPTLWSAHSARPWSATPMRTAPGSSHRQQRAP